MSLITQPNKKCSLRPKKNCFSLNRWSTLRILPHLRETEYVQWKCIQRSHSVLHDRELGVEIFKRTFNWWQRLEPQYHLSTQQAGDPPHKTVVSSVAQLRFQLSSPSSLSQSRQKVGQILVKRLIQRLSWWQEEENRGSVRWTSSSSNNC